MDNIVFLQEVRNYIEETEVAMDGEWGFGRTLQELIAEKRMPALYAEVLQRLQA